MSRFKNTLYKKTYLKFKESNFCYEETDDGTLLSGHHRTKIYAEDLPEWYVYGRYYKEWGFLSTKGITDLKYVPNNWINHFLKDDGLYIAYGGKIEEYEKDEYHPTWERLKGYDHCVCGSGILDILKGAEIYSDYDISGIVQQLRDKRKLIAKKHPREFGYDVFKFSVDEWLAEPFDNHRAEKRYAIQLSDTKRYYGTIEEIYTAFSNCDERLIEPVKFIDSAFTYDCEKEWIYRHPNGKDISMRYDAVTIPYIIIKDRDEYIRCCRPRFHNLQRKYGEVWEIIECPVGRNDIVLTVNSADIVALESLLQLPENRTTSNKAQVKELMSKPFCFDAICNELFENEK